MKPDALLDCAVFQLTPTRTRCELFISSKGESEKVASGLLQPFLAHLRTAEEQIAVGGYSIRLEPPVEDVKAGWFTKATMQRFLRFVSTPEVLERVTAVETELIQLDEELSNYIEGDDQHSMVSGGRYFTKYKQLRRDSLPGDEAENDTAKGRLIKALEARYFQLQREQGMAFARAIAAGFDMDHLSDLLAFAECFGAARLSVACHKFAALCKKQQEGGLWLDEMEKVAAEGDNFNYQETNTGITIAPAGLNPLTLPEARPPAALEESSLKEVEVDVDRRGGDYRRQSSGSSYMDQQNHPQVMGMPPSYPSWHFEQGYDPRYFPQGVVPVAVPYVNGGFPPMNPYWNVPPNGHAASPTSPAEDSDEEKERKGSKKNGRKTNSPRRKTATLKRLSGGRGGKRSGMVVIRNINYITPTQESAAKKNKNTEDECNGSSDFETSSEVDEQNGVSKKKKTRPKKVLGGEVSSEGSRASTSGETKKEFTDEAFFTVPVRSSLHPGENGFSFDMESFPQHRSGTSSEALADDSFVLHGGGRVNGIKGGTQYGLEDQMKSSNIASKDGLLLPHRNQGESFGATNHDSELSFRNPVRVDLNDSHIIPDRMGLRDTTRPVEEPLQVPKQEDHSKETSFEEFFIVPSRPVRETSEVTRRTFEVDIPESGQQLASVKEKPVQGFEPEMLPERPKDTGERRWNDVAYDMELMAAMQSKPASEENNEGDQQFYEQYHEQRDVKIMKESGTKKAEREAKMKSLQDALDKRKTELSSRFKSTRSSILKSKKEKEEAERKRIEDLAEERRNRIAARSGTSRAPSKSISSVSKTRASPVPSTATQRPSSSATKPSGRALSSTMVNKDSDGAKKPLPGRSTNALSKSVASLSELRKENAKPVGVRQQGSTRKSIDTVREVKTSGTPAVGRGVAKVDDYRNKRVAKAG